MNNIILRYDIHYKNIVKLVEYRKYDSMSQIDEDGFKKQLYENNYVEVKCNNSKDNTELIIFIFLDVDSIQKKSAFESFMKKKINKGNDFLFIVPKILNQHANFAVLYEGVKIVFTEYNVVTFDVPNHKLVPKFEKISIEHFNKQFDKYKCNINFMARILLSDPMVIWCGAKKGDIIKITNGSENTGLSITYKIVV